MAHADTAEGKWSSLEGKRQTFIGRCEKYAAFTIPKLCLPNGRSSNASSLSHDYQSVGAQCVNHLSNKLMLTLFSMSRPFFRADPSASMQQEVSEAGGDALASKMAEALALGEKRAMKLLEQMGCRPRLYEAIKHLIVTGNVLLKLEKKGLRTFGLKRYVVQRSHEGTLMHLLLKSEVSFSDLEPDVQEYLTAQGEGDKKRYVLYNWIKRRDDGSYLEQQWVNTCLLDDPKFTGNYKSIDSLPYRVLTWDLAEGDDYGTGLVEDYEGDFASLSALSESQIQSAILASEFRWLVNPAGMTKVEDLERSSNGAALPGTPEDIKLLQSGNGENLTIVQAIGQDYISRIGRGFLLNSAVTRDAERVTAEEIRIQATELETALGGVYSRLAVDFQLPMARWLCAMIELNLDGKDFEPVIVTGLDALSRSGEVELIKAFLMDLAALTNMPPALLQVLKLGNVARLLAAGRGLKADDYVMSEEEQEAQQKQQAELMAQQQATEAGIAAAAQQVAGE
ncbi:head-tail adaptor [Aquamicrobium phage P14]|uniref:Putative head-to-tail joining protein n=1 Tax=Aquamicrobium phage P14 TaxID=1927013 RepID=A0A1L5C061_9CAUD|nr:head-tail adaptor [Aquamicrobium phage P14]APL99493.1 putative head-to-tail joining protein [Aquamicrobium phage P14]